MSRLERALEDCLTRLSRGEATLEECLSRYPEEAAELRRLLGVVEYLERGRAVSPRPAFKAEARARLVAHMRANPRDRKKAFGVPFALGRAFNFASGVLAVVILFLFTGTVLAQAALPGDSLYSWRVGSERVWRSLHPDLLVADIALSNRHARDLASVAGNSEAEPVARQDYRQTLDYLDDHTAPEEKALISQALIEQQASLAQVRVIVPELEQFLATVAPLETSLALEHAVAAVQARQITYALTVRNEGPAGPATVTLTDTLSPAEMFVAAEGDARCTTPGPGQLTCRVDNLAAGEARRLALTTTIQRCYAGPVANTAVVAGTGRTLNTNPDNRVMAETVVSLPFPQEAQVAYVQSDGRGHDLGLVTASTLSPDLPRHTAAPAWSPDGARLAFFGEDGISERGGVYSQGNGLWVVDVSNGRINNPRQLIALDHIRNTAWSPDGRRLAFEVGPPGQTHEVVVVEAGSGEPVSRFPGEQPAWSPDSRQLVVRSCAPDCGLWRVNLDGRGGVRLTSGSTDSYPAWSPGGEYLVFASERDGNWEIYRLGLADNELVRLTGRPGTDTTPVFGPCGEEIYLRTDQFGGWWITVMRLDGSDERMVREGVGASDDWGLARPAVY